jgi:hypothetical protein
VTIGHAGVAGVDAEFAWVSAEAAAAGALPSGLVIRHDGHDLLVPWVSWPGGPSQVFTLDSLRPLTVVEDVRCAGCGVSGRIEAGAWVPTKGGSSW